MILHARKKSHEYDDIIDQNERPWNLECTTLFDRLRVVWQYYKYLNDKIRNVKIWIIILLQICE